MQVYTCSDVLNLHCNTCCAVHRFVESADKPRTDPVVLWMVGCNAVYVNVVSVADPNQPQCGSLPVSRKVICAGVGVSLGPRPV